MHHTLTVIITQELAGQLRSHARAHGFVDERHFTRDLLFKAVGLEVPAEPYRTAKRLPPCQLKIMRTLAADGAQPLCVTDLIRATGFSHQSIHMNTKALLMDEQIEVSHKSSEGNTGAPRRYFRPTARGLTKLAETEQLFKASHDALQRTAEASTIAVGAAPDALDNLEAEELRAVRARHEARRQREQAWKELSQDDYSRCFRIMAMVVFATTNSMEAVKVKQTSLGEYIKRRFMEGADMTTLEAEADAELDKLGHTTASVTALMKAATNVPPQNEVVP